MTDAAETPSPFATAAELSAALRRGGTTSAAIIRRALDRTAAHEPALHAFVEIFGEAALAAAEATDDRRARGVPLRPARRHFPSR
ncbi:hypothetical protein [Inquilinus limosus]|uniref:hypothetical protein n=1 Tax=Inquilinus limosus TaxID=171674 RepID=UPI00068BF74A|nr:hypothetical protein [Inquilinus limosus]